MSAGRCRIEIVTPEELLAFEARWPRHTPDKDEAIRRRLGLSPVRYYQLLHRAASSVEGIREHPITARRVRQTLARRAASRERNVA